MACCNCILVRRTAGETERSCYVAFYQEKILPELVEVMIAYYVNVPITIKDNPEVLSKRFKSMKKRWRQSRGESSCWTPL